MSPSLTLAFCRPLIHKPDATVGISTCRESRSLAHQKPFCGRWRQKEMARPHDASHTHKTALCIALAHSLDLFENAGLLLPFGLMPVSISSISAILVAFTPVALVTATLVSALLS